MVKSMKILNRYTLFLVYTFIFFTSLKMLMPIQKNTYICVIGMFTRPCNIKFEMFILKYILPI